MVLNANIGIVVSLLQVFEDKFARREILAISVGCTHHSSGCSWNGELRELEVRNKFLYSTENNLKSNLNVQKSSSRLSRCFDQNLS